MLPIPEPIAPIEEIKLPLYQKAGVYVFMKREDLSHPFISGNKWRKLKYHLLEAHQQQKETLLTFGGAYSNHLLATAAAGAKYGFKTMGVVRGEAVKNPTLGMCQLFGMQLEFLSREEFKIRKEAPNTFYPQQSYHIIPEGGAGELGEQGVAELVEVWEYDHVFCAVGTGSTLKGLIQGMQSHTNKGLVNGIVVLKGAEAMADEFAMFPPNSYKLHFNYHEGGYAKSNEALMAYIQHFASQTGILLDQVYEAKMMKALNDLIAKGFINKGEKVLAIHNGGLMGLLSQLV